MATLSGQLSVTPDMTRRQRRLVRDAIGARNKNVLILLLFPVMFLAKIIVAYLLPPKYFYDNNRILRMVNGTAGDDAWAGSYQVATDLFVQIKTWTQLQTMLDWSICIGVIGTVILAFLIARGDAPDLLQSIFILASVGLLNIYIFNIGKDVIQFTFFFGVYLVLILPIERSWVKVLGSAAILYYESTFFRSYYVLIAALVIAVYAVLSYFRRRSTLGGRDVAAIIVTLFVIITGVMAFASIAMKDEYGQIMTVRETYDDTFSGSADSSTFIQSWIPNESHNLAIFMVNYVLNAFRMMVPIELALRGPYYWPFFLFQVMVSVYLVNLLRQLNRIDEPMLFIAVCVFVGYVLASVLFEPDFGSWVRHETATFPVLHLLVLNRFNRIALTREERMLSQGGV